MAPTLLVVNARIATGDPKRPWATGLAFDEKILAAIASAAELVKRAGPSTRVIDAGGRTLRVPPGVGVGSVVRVAVSEDGDVTLIEEKEA